ncbi:MAG: 1-acyl-sn-glycerol-3-phosphate acyltransferase [Actinomycetota bacterium]|nr:1-acyl-sn-glycerol-3-phosphate acyltransferase [Actinomycetota bacterium]
MGKVRWEGAEPVYRAVVRAAITSFKLMGWKVRIFGAENLPAEGPAVIASNHVGYLDFVFIGYGARAPGRVVRFMAKQEVFTHPLTGPLMRAMRHIPVDRYGAAHAALAESRRRLERGQVVGMFPEGTISPSFVPREGKAGAARIAMTAGAPLIPAAVWGTQRILTKWRPRNFQRGVAIDVHFGAPIPWEPGEDSEVVTERLMDAIRKLVDRAAAAYPQQPAGEHDRWWLPAHLGGTAPTPEEAEERLARQRAEERQALRQRARERRAERDRGGS